MRKKGGNVWYFRRRVKAGCERLHFDAKGKPQSQLFFSLKTTDMAEAARKADAFSRRQDTLWNDDQQSQPDLLNANAAVGMLDAVGLMPGDAKRYPNAPALDRLIDNRYGRYEPWEEQPESTPEHQIRR